MSITDLWGNSLNGITTDVIGYRGDFTEFPHDLYSYLSSTIRDDDQKRVSLLYRWLLGAESYWEAQYNSILGLSTLLSPTECPAKYLEYLRYNVGIHNEFNYIWGTMTENEKRAFVKNYTNIIKFRYSDSGIKLILEKLTKEFVYLRDFFYYRWILSGDVENEMETALGREDDGYDPWLIGDENYLTGQIPDYVYVNQGDSSYRFVVTEMINGFVYDTIPTHAYVRCLVTNESTRANIYYDSGDYYIDFYNYYFGMSFPVVSVDINQFRISFESDPYISDILITNRDALINTDMIEALVKYNRVASERFYIRYYNWIDNFNDDIEYWEVVPTYGTVEHDDDNNTMIIDSAVAKIGVTEITLPGSTAWSDYDFTTKIKYTQGTNATEYYYIRFLATDDTANYFEIVVTINNREAAYPQATLDLRGYIGAMPIAGLTTGVNLYQLDPDVYYTWRICTYVVDIAGVDYQKFQIFLDEELLIDDEIVKTALTSGYISYVRSIDIGYPITIDNVSVKSIHSVDTYIGL